jgi:hypothetical protein
MVPRAPRADASPVARLMASVGKALRELSRRKRIAREAPVMLIPEPVPTPETASTSEPAAVEAPLLHPASLSDRVRAVLAAAAATGLAGEFERGRDCGLCLFPMRSGEETHMLRCGHVFHLDCVLRTVQSRFTRHQCAVCFLRLRGFALLTQTDRPARVSCLVPNRTQSWDCKREHASDARLLSVMYKPPCSDQHKKK